MPGGWSDEAGKTALALTSSLYIPSKKKFCELPNLPNGRLDKFHFLEAVSRSRSILSMLICFEKRDDFQCFEEHADPTFLLKIPFVDVLIIPNKEEQIT